MDISGLWHLHVYEINGNQINKKSSVTTDAHLTKKMYVQYKFIQNSHFVKYKSYIVMELKMSQP